jgi:hypothetical protein
MNRLKRSMLVGMLTIVLITLLTAELAQAAGLTDAKWSIVPSPNVAKFNQLRGVVAVSASNLWAVGKYATSRRGLGKTLTEFFG